MRESTHKGRAIPALDAAAGEGRALLKGEVKSTGAALTDWLKRRGDGATNFYSHTERAKARKLREAKG